MRVHREWVRECVKRYEENVVRGMKVLGKRVVGVRRKGRERENLEDLEREDEEPEEMGRSWGAFLTAAAVESIGGSERHALGIGKCIEFTDARVDAE